MLKYLIDVTKNLLLTAVLLGLLSGYLRPAYGRKGHRIFLIGTAAGFAAAIVMSILKNTTSLVHTGVWNIRIFTVSLAALALFGIFSLRSLRGKPGAAGEIAAPVCAAALAFTFMLYAFPDVLAYPFNFTLNGVSLLSTDFLYRLIGWVAGLALMLVTFFAVRNAALRAGTRAAGALSGAVLVINGLQQFSKLIQLLLSRRVIPTRSPLYRPLFQVAKYTSNYSDWFIYAAIVAALALPVVLLVRSLHVNEPYENPAQHRKIRAVWRSTRRWSAAVIVCFFLAVSNMTWVNAVNSREIELSPVEDSELRGDNVYVPLEQVEDGHLHRFAYTTPNGKTVRFIVIKKPNSSSYGIGLDACDVCGETGYFERNGQIVCKLCDVVMNINTIGFKGGCNPIVIDYSVEGGYIIVPTDTLIEHENEFK